MTSKKQCSNIKERVRESKKLNADNVVCLIRRVEMSKSKKMNYVNVSSKRKVSAAALLKKVVSNQKALEMGDHTSYTKRLMDKVITRLNSLAYNPNTPYSLPFSLSINTSNEKEVVAVNKYLARFSSGWKHNRHVDVKKCMLSVKKEISKLGFKVTIKEDTKYNSNRRLILTVSLPSNK